MTRRKLDIKVRSSRGVLAEHGFGRRYQIDGMNAEGSSLNEGRPKHEIICVDMDMTMATNLPST